jgi:peptidoglycan/LPS O-acetylase OafA/YrhL
VSKVVNNNFNFLRLLAALQVVYIHTIEHLNITNKIILFIKYIIAYFPGVPIFFLISGYLITMSYEKNPDIKEYAKNRILRISPGLYVSFFLGLTILWYFNQFHDISTINVVPWMVAQLSFFQFYNPEFIRDFGVGVINGSLWTISVELCFYMILPLLYIFLQKDFIKRVSMLLLISFGFYYYIHEISANTLIYEKLIKASIVPYLFYFLFGITMYKFRDKLIKYVENKVLLFLGIYALVCMFKVDLFLYDVIKQVMFSVFIFSFVFSYKSLSHKIVGNNDFTYGVYIYHMLIVNVMVEKGILGGTKSHNSFGIFFGLWGAKLFFDREAIFKNEKTKFV